MVCLFVCFHKSLIIELFGRSIYVRTLRKMLSSYFHVGLFLMFYFRLHVLCFTVFSFQLFAVCAFFCVCVLFCLQNRKRNNFIPYEGPINMASKTQCSHSLHHFLFTWHLNGPLARLVLSSLDRNLIRKLSKTWKIVPPHEMLVDYFHEYNCEGNYLSHRRWHAHINAVLTSLLFFPGVPPFPPT